MLGRYNESNIFFLDEVGFNVSMRSKFGRSKVGTTPFITVPNIRSRNISVCCCMSKSGQIFKKTSLRPYNIQLFNTFIEDFLNYLDENNLSNYLIILDNVRFHKNQEALSLITTKGHQMKFLPPYSPFLNPIENMFSKWKNSVKRRQSNDEEELFHNIESSLNEITSSDCLGFYQNMMTYISRSLNREEIILQNVEVQKNEKI